MNYQEQLTPWVVYQMLADSQRQFAMRFRRRNDADAYVKLMKKTQPQIEFMIAFEASNFGKNKVVEAKP
jgi:uncharacterized protein (UPF0371 family)